jgi:hypothetical protein
MHYAHLPVAEAPAFAAYRTQPGWEICAEDDRLWLRAANPDTDLWQAIPFAGRYRADAAQRLTCEGQSVPSRQAPVGPWTDVANWLPIQRSITVPPGVRPPPVSIKPVRTTDEERPSNLLIVARQEWDAWVLMAPVARLDVLSFALSSDGRVCVRGLLCRAMHGCCMNGSRCAQALVFLPRARLLGLRSCFSCPVIALPSGTRMAAPRSCLPLPSCQRRARMCELLRWHTTSTDPPCCLALPVTT